MEKANNIFTKCFLKDWLSLSKNEEAIVSNRKFFLNKKFIFSNTNIQKLRQINAVLREKELEINEKKRLIETQQQQLTSANSIDDYNWEVGLFYFNNTGFYEQWSNEFEGNAFYKDWNLHLFNEGEKDPIYFEDNWNEFVYNNDHPLAREYYCYLFKHLYTCSHLAWEDILRIDEIWVEIKITNQYFINL